MPKMSEGIKTKLREIGQRIKKKEGLRKAISTKEKKKKTFGSPMKMERKKEGYRSKVQKAGGNVQFMDELMPLKTLTSKGPGKLKLARGGRIGLKSGSGPIRVDHPKDHPDVKKMEKSVKKDREKTKEKFPILSKIFGTGNPKKDKQKAKRIADSLQTMGAKIRTETEGSFARGGRIGLKAGSKGCKLAMKGRGRAYGKNS